MAARAAARGSWPPHHNQRLFNNNAIFWQAIVMAARFAAVGLLEWRSAARTAQGRRQLAPMRSLTLTTIAGAAAVLGTAGSAPAQTYPVKPVRLLVGFAPGGATDIAARAVAQQLSQPLGQTVVVDNRPGAAGNLAADLVAKAPPDGYTILLVNA